MFKNIIICLLVLATAYFAWIACTITADPVSRVYEQYNHLRIYEDGSYTGEDRNGETVQGCLNGGLCQD